MFADFDYKDYPIVKVTLNNTIENDNDFNDFTNKWELLNNYKKNYELIFDTKNCGYISIKYCIFMAFFIKKLKKQKIKYLQKSKIFVFNNYILNLLKFIFYFETPIAPVEIIYKNNKDQIQKIEIINI